MLKGETVRNSVTLSRSDLYSSVTFKAGRTSTFVSPPFSTTSFSTFTGKVPLFWFRIFIRRFNFSLRRFSCGLPSVTSLTLSVAFLLDEVMCFKMVLAGGGLEAGNAGLFGKLMIGLSKDTASGVPADFPFKPAVSASKPLSGVLACGGLETGNSGLFGSLMIGLSKDTASGVSAGFPFKPAVSASKPLFDGELRVTVAFVGFMSTWSGDFVFGISCDLCSGRGASTFTASVPVLEGAVRGEDETAIC